MPTIIAATALIPRVSGDIKYPVVYKETYLSDERVQNAIKTERALSSKHGCIKIGKEIISEGDRAGETFSIFTCCTSL